MGSASLQRTRSSRACCRPSIELWGTPWTQRLLPDAHALIPETAGIEGRRQPSGEVKLEVDLDAVFPGRAVPCAPAGPIVELVRGTGGPTRIEPTGSDLEFLWPWDGGWTSDHERGAERLAAQPRYRLHMNGTPDEAVDALERLLDGLGGGPAARG